MMDGCCCHLRSHPRKSVLHGQPGNIVEIETRIENDRNLGIWVQKSSLVIGRQLSHKLAYLARGGLIGITRFVEAAKKSPVGSGRDRDLVLSEFLGGFVCEGCEGRILVADNHSCFRRRAWAS